jgi:hypothetical protein
MCPKLEERGGAWEKHFCFVLSGSKTISALAGNRSVLLGSSMCEDLIVYRMIYNIPGCIGFAKLWSGAGGFGLGEFCPSQLCWLLPSFLASPVIP